MLASNAPGARRQNERSSAEVSCPRRFASLYTTRRSAGDSDAAALAPGLFREQVASVEESPGGKGEEAHLAWACCWRLVLRVDDMCAPNR